MAQESNLELHRSVYYLIQMKYNLHIVFDSINNN